MRTTRDDPRVRAHSRTESKDEMLAFKRLYACLQNIIYLPAKDAIGVSALFQNSGIFAGKLKNLGKFQHFLNYRRNSDKISSKSEQKSMKRIQKKRNFAFAKKCEKK